MSPTRGVLLFAVVAALSAGRAEAEPIRAAVRSWVTPNAGATLFAPAAGTLTADGTLDLTPGQMHPLAGFHPSDAWVTPAATPPAEATLVQKGYGFVYTVEVTDAASGQTGRFDLPGMAYARWVERSDGSVVQEQLGVELGAAAGPLTLGANRYRLERMAYSTGGGLVTRAGFDLENDLELRAGAEVLIAAAPGVPEPATLALAAGGLGVIGLRTWRRKPA